MFFFLKLKDENEGVFSWYTIRVRNTFLNAVLNTQKEQSYTLF